MNEAKQTIALCNDPWQENTTNVNFSLLSDNVCLIAAVHSRIVLYVAHARASNKPTVHFFLLVRISLGHFSETI